MKSHDNYIRVSIYIIAGNLFIPSRGHGKRDSSSCALTGEARYKDFRNAIQFALTIPERRACTPRVGAARGEFRSSRPAADWIVTRVRRSAMKTGWSRIHIKIVIYDRPAPIADNESGKKPRVAHTLRFVKGEYSFIDARAIKIIVVL